MLWHKKEDKSALPDLPKGPDMLPSFPDESDLNKEKNALPSFPDSPSYNKFSESIIKEAISDTDTNQEQKEEQQENPDFNPDVIKINSVSNWKPSMPQKQNFKPPETIKLKEKVNWKPTIQDSQISKAAETPEQISIPDFKPFSPPKPVSTDVFIKIEKYHAVRRALVDVKSKLEQIDELLSKIRDTKLREEQELSLWEKEISNSKIRIEEITKNIFEKV